MAEKTQLSVPSVVSRTVARVAAAEGFKKPQIHVESGSNAGDGYTSSLYRVTVRDEDTSGGCFSSRPLRKDDLVLMVKVPDANSDVPFIKVAFESEGTMYKSILPAFQEIAKMKVALPWPRCYHASAEGPETSLAFEDLRLKGFVMKNRREPMDAPHCRLALSQLAKFHGAGLALQHLKPDTFKALTGSLKNPYNNPDSMAMFAQMSQVVQQSLVMLTETYPEGSVVYTKLQQVIQSFATEGPKLMATTPEPAPGVAIMHGDCHSNNMMFRYDQTSAAVTTCRLIDFQMSRAGPTANDLVTLLLPCTDKSTRDKHWEELLRGYHTELQNTLRTAGCKDPDAVYSWTQFIDSMRQAAPLAVLIAPLLLHAQFADEQAAEQLREALHDMGKAEQTSGGLSIKPSDELKRRLTDIVRSLVEWDWL